MSGGSLDYVCYKVHDAASSIADRAKGKNNLTLIAYAEFLHNVADILHDIEWDFSSDRSLTQEDYDKMIAMMSPQMLLEVSVEHAEKLLEELKNIVEKLKGTK